MRTSNSRSRQHSAVGHLGELGEDHRPLFETTEHFVPKNDPDSGEWLAEHYEPGQPFEKYRRRAAFRPCESSDTIYLRPLKPIDDVAEPNLEVVAEFARAYYQMDADVLPPIDASDRTFSTRSHPSNEHRQVLTTDIVDYLRRRIPDDAFCLLGVTTDDLYPKPSWNFVFGQAWPTERTGIFSSARYHRNERVSALKRTMKVMAHEVGHLFGINHCVHFDCAMNGSNNLEEADERPIHLCPVELRKVHWAVGLDPVERYESLEQFYSRHGFDREAAWVASRLDLVT